MSKLKKFEVIFSYAHNEYFVVKNDQSKEHLLAYLQYELAADKREGCLTIFEDYLINPEGLQTVEVREFNEREENDTI